MSLHTTISSKPVQWLKAMALLVLLVLAHASALAQATVTFFHNDIAGTPLAATDSAGNLLWKETYRPYGERLTHSPPSSTNSVWFTSKPQDPHTGLVYMGARYYDPVIGRFMGTDPVGFVQGNVHSVNRYAYANNNPYRFVDPDGKHPLVVFAAVGLFMLDFHHAATSNEPFTGIGSSVAQGGRLAGNVFTKGAASEVAAAATAAKVGTRGASGTLETVSGGRYLGNSTGSAATGGASRAPMNPKVQEALDAVQKPSRSHGHCCEIDAANKALNAGDSVAGAKMGPVQLNETGRVLPACSTCREVMRFLGIE